MPRLLRAADPWQRDPLLSQLLVQQMLTDASGFRWVATDEGVFRYDGYELLPLRKLLRPSSAAPPAQHVPALALDHRGRLWIGAENGLWYFDQRTGHLQAVPLPDAPATHPDVLTLYCHPRTGQLWVSYARTRLLLLDTGRHPRSAGPSRLLPGTPFYFQADGSPDGVWLSIRKTNWPDRSFAADGAKPAAMRLGPNGPPRQRIAARCYLVPVPSTVPLRLFSASAWYEAQPDGRVRELRRWLPAGGEDSFRPLGQEADTLREWISQGHHVALTVRGPQAGRAALDAPHFDGAAGPGRDFYTMEQDAQGTRWAYSLFWRGCYLQQPAARVVQAVLTARHRPAPSARGIVRLPDGRLLLGGYGGCWTQAADSPAAPLRHLATTWGGRPYEVLGYDFLVTRAGRVLVAEEARGLSELNPRTGTIGLLPVDTSRGRPGRILTLLQSRAGRVWVGAEAGLFYLDEPRDQLRRYGSPAVGKQLARLEITDLAEDPGSRALWLATTTGLYQFEPRAQVLRRVGGPAGPGRALPTAALNCVAASGPGRAWVGTRTEGLLLADARTGLVRQLGLAEGLPSYTIATVLCPPDGRVWAGTYAGLVRYEPATQRLAVFGPAEGLTDPELNRNSAYADSRAGALWFGGVGGLFRVPPATTRPNARQARPQLVATAIATPAGDEGENLRYLSGSEQPALHLPTGPRAYVELRLALSSYFAPGLSRYTYRLRGATEATAWRPTAHRLLLQDLPAGDYTLEIKAETATGQLAANVLRFPLHIDRVWWQHPLAWALAACLLVMGTYGLFWLQGRRARREAHLREELAANLHDEVGALLTRINLQAQLLREQHTPADTAETVPSTASSGFDRLLANSATAVQTMRDVVWSIDARADSVGALLDRMREHLSQLGDTTGLRMSLHTSGLPDNLPLAPALRQNLYLIYKEALTNAVRHAKAATEIRATLLRQAGALELEIVDDGQYQPPATPKRASGMGLRNMVQRAKTLGGELQTGARSDGQPGYRVWLRVG